ncbi:MAG: OmpA family protein [Leptospiraceae bacterium]|nr:OmpA family protein [Leptospiraceae bacterium]
MKRIVFLFITSTLMGACATTYQGDDYSLLTGEVAPLKDTSISLSFSKEGEACSEIVRKRIYYGLFLLPMNELTLTEFSPSEEHSYRVRTLVSPLDVLISAMGFMVSILSQTVLVQECSPSNQMDKNTIRTNGPLSKSKNGKDDRETIDQRISLPHLLYPAAAPQTQETGYTFFFGFNEAVVREPYDAPLKVILSAFRNAENPRILLVGHTDPWGTESVNVKLGLARARAVKQLLVKGGIPAHRILMASAANHWPATFGKVNTGSKMGPNERRRRVEVFFLSD